MRRFGLTLARTFGRLKAAVSSTTAGLASLSTISSRGGWYRIFEPFTGAWQRNISWTTESVLSFAAVYACVTLIASDIGKLCLRLVEQDQDGIWNEVESAAFSPVLRKPNHYQTRIKFIEQWMISKLIHGNAYVLKARDQRGVVVALYVLDPSRVTVQVSDDGNVYYSLGSDNLAPVAQQTVVPASEIIHDVMVPLYHPLCGVSPITACGLAALQGLRVQNHSTAFFTNGARPGGMLTSPGIIPQEVAKQYQEEWEANYGGDNVGRIAVLGGGLKYEPMSVMSAVDAQLIEQLKWSAENVCTAFRVPGYMVGVGQAPAYNNIEALTQQYYGQCLQTHIESIEALLDEGLGLNQKIDGRRMGTEFDLDDLLRMDTATQVKAGAEAIGSGGVSPNEARKRFFGLGPVTGGESPYLQQQNYSLAALAKRDASADPFGTTSPDRPTQPEPSPTPQPDQAKWIAEWHRKSAGLVLAA